MGLSELTKRCSELRAEIRGANVRGTVDLLAALPAFLRAPITPDQAAEDIRKMLETREERFLEQARVFIYRNPASPYLRLLENAGCDENDLRLLVHRHGVERALQRLAAEGVYLTADEFKGKHPVVRGNERFRVSPRNFEAAQPSPGYLTQSSGTMNPPLRTFASLDWLAARSLSTCVFFSAHELFNTVHAVYDTILPGSAGINQTLIYARVGVVADRWFARKLPLTLSESVYFNAITRLILLTAQWFGRGAPKLQVVDFDDVGLVLDWVRQNSRHGHTSCITTAASNAARIARCAHERRVSLQGLCFVVSGEPFTDSKREAVEGAGATATVRCTYGGSINVGFGCADRIHTDEVHVNQHLLALTSHRRTVRGDVEVEPLLCTTFDPSAPRFLFNVESGDYAILRERKCRCKLGEAGLQLHLHRMRSFEKFTSEGMNYFFVDLFQILENTLPGEFGGGPGDYQIVEEEDGVGQSHLTLLVHPRVCDLDENKLHARLLEILKSGSPGNRVMTMLWNRTGTIRIKREPPRASDRGKILPLHFPRRSHPRDGHSVGHHR